MAYLLRLILVVVLFASSSAHALIPKVTGYLVTTAVCSQYGGTQPTPQGAADAYRALFNTKGGSACGAPAPADVMTECHPVSNNTAINCSTSATPNRYYASLSSQAAAVCPANSVASGTQCQCASGYKENAAKTACEPLPTASEKWKQWCQAAAGQSLGFQEMPGRNSRSGCQNLTLAGSPISTPGYIPGEVPQDAGCKITLGNSRSFPDADGSWYTQGDASVTGGTCREGDPAAGDPAGTEKQPEAKPPKCVGGYEGTVNGTSVCAKPDTTKGIDWAGTKTETKSDGTSKTTESDTKCKDGSCTTTTKETTRDSTGTVTGTNTTTTKESAGSLCARDKGNGACTATGAGGAGGGEGDGNSFNGNCVAGFKAVSEDAVLNAMAEEQYRRNCEILRTDTEPSQWAQQEGQRTDDRTSTNPYNQTVNVGPSSFDTSDALGGGSCSLNKTIVVRGFTVTLPFDNICSSLAMLGNVLLAISFLLAARIVGRG